MRKLLKAQELPHPGHYICSSRCQFRRHTHVGDYCVSTVGEFTMGDDSKYEDIGAGRKYETMVFRISWLYGYSCCPNCPGGGEELKVRGYNDPDAAQAGHNEIVKAIQQGEKP